MVEWATPPDGFIPFDDCTADTGVEDDGCAFSWPKHVHGPQLTMDRRNEGDIYYNIQVAR
jgi:hypothetical protein